MPPWYPWGVSTVNDRAARAVGRAPDPRHDLVADRLRDAGVRLRPDAVAEQRHRRADRQLAVELDRESVHRDRPDDASELAGDTNLGPGQVAPEAVGVADRDDADP